MSKRVCIFSAYYPPDWKQGGTVQSIYSITNQFNKEFIVNVFSTSDKKTYKKSFLNSKGCKINIHFFKSISVFRFSVKQFFLSYKYLKETDYVYINGLWFWSSIFAVFMSKVFNFKLIIAPRGMLLPSAFQNKIYLKYILIFFYKLISNNQKTLVHWTSLYEKRNSIYKFLKTKSIITPNHIIEKEIWKIPKLNPKSKIFTLIYLGRLHPIKNLEKLILAVNMINKKELLIRLKIIGSGKKKYKRKLVSLVKNNFKAINFKGQLNGIDRIKSIDQSHLGILVSKNEKFGISVAEILARGRPVLISSNVGIKEYISKSKACFVVNNPKIKNIKLELLKLINLYKKGKIAKLYREASDVASLNFKEKEEKFIFNMIK